MRKNNSSDPEERALQNLINKAIEEVSNALRIAKRSRNPKSREVLCSLEKVLFGLNSVGSLSVPAEPEKDKLQLFREEMKKRWAEKRLAEKVQKV